VNPPIHRCSSPTLNSQRETVSRLNRHSRFELDLILAFPFELEPLTNRREDEFCLEKRKLTPDTTSSATTKGCIGEVWKG